MLLSNAFYADTLFLARCRQNTSVVFSYLLPVGCWNARLGHAGSSQLHEKISQVPAGRVNYWQSIYQGLPDKVQKNSQNLALMCAIVHLPLILFPLSVTFWFSKSGIHKCTAFTWGGETVLFLRINYIIKLLLKKNRAGVFFPSSEYSTLPYFLPDLLYSAKPFFFSKKLLLPICQTY